MAASKLPTQKGCTFAVPTFGFNKYQTSIFGDFVPTILPESNNVNFCVPYLTESILGRVESNTSLAIDTIIKRPRLVVVI